MGIPPDQVHSPLFLIGQMNHNFFSASSTLLRKDSFEGLLCQRTMPQGRFALETASHYYMC